MEEKLKQFVEYVFKYLGTVLTQVPVEYLSSEVAIFVIQHFKCPT